MPELPEIAAHAERLGRAFAGAELAGFTPLHPTALKTFDPRPDSAAGRQLTGAGHRGKYLCLHFGDLTFVVHLMQGGRLRPHDPPASAPAKSSAAAIPADTNPAPDANPVDVNPAPAADPSTPASKPPAKKPTKPRGGMARWSFADGRELLLTEAGTERRAGVWLVRGDPEGQEPLSRLGPDADRIDRGELARGLAAARERIHGYLRDQSRLAGIGRLLANEILHEARISPFANTARLDADRIDRLHQAMTAVIAKGLAHERTRPEMGKSADRPSNVHHRIGQPCTTCGDEVRSVAYRRYVVAYCPACQTGGKVLADNTTSRFLK